MLISWSVLILHFEPMFTLHFTLSVQPAFGLHFTLGLQSAIHSPQSN